MFTNPDFNAISSLLGKAHRIAVVGLSADSSRPSHQVALGMQSLGYRIVPVTPHGGTLLGETCYPDLAAAATTQSRFGAIDIVNVFRRPEHVADIVSQCLHLAFPALWLQDGVIDEEATERARSGGMFVVMDRCIWRDRVRLGHSGAAADAG
ncbi:MAG: CoA-binding protein [Steroidobacteraceae bacterium]